VAQPGEPMQVINCPVKTTWEYGYYCRWLRPRSLTVRGRLFGVAFIWWSARYQAQHMAQPKYRYIYVLLWVVAPIRARIECDVPWTSAPAPNCAQRERSYHDKALFQGRYLRSRAAEYYSPDAREVPRLWMFLEPKSVRMTRWSLLGCDYWGR
jgi:hypothetical protein